jgi:thiol-disulfide isomerase/thioredoxin
MYMPYEGAEGEYEMMDDNGNMMRNDAIIHSYEACIAAGYPMMKSMPPQCATDDGSVFVQGGESMGEPMMNPDMVREEESVDHGGWVDEMGKPGQYTLFFDGVIGNGLESVLFFHAAWCPYCIAHNTQLQSWYGSEKFPRSTYKIDYDTADELKKMFNVTNQDTFILIDGNGNEIKRVTFPAESALHELLGTF